MTTLQELTLLDQLDRLNHMIKQTEEFGHYCKYNHLINNDPEVLEIISTFKRMKEDFEEVSRFGKYHPDFTTKRREINQYKKKLDLHPIVMEFRRAEYQLQALLDEVLFHMSEDVSEHVNIVSDNPFFAKDSGGGCATGGSCSCAV